MMLNKALDNTTCPGCQGRGEWLMWTPNGEIWERCDTCNGRGDLHHLPAEKVRSLNRKIADISLDEMIEDFKKSPSKIEPLEPQKAAERYLQSRRKGLRGYLHGFRLAVVDMARIGLDALRGEYRGRR